MQLDVERAELDVVGPLGSRLLPADVGDHPEEAPYPLEASSAEERRCPGVADEVRGLEDDPAVLGPFRPELEHPGLDQVEHTVSDAAAGELRMDVAVPDEAASLAVEQVRHACDPPVELDEPRVALEVEPVPLVPEVARGPVGVAVHGDVRGAENVERLVEAVGCRAQDTHRAHPTHGRDVSGCGQPYVDGASSSIA